MELKELSTYPKSGDVDKNMDMKFTGDGILHLVFDKIKIDATVEGGKVAITLIVDNQEN